MRIISRLDIKNEFVIKGINLEGLRKIGDPIEIARQYYLNGVDEIILIDAVASLYGRNNLFEIVKRTTENLFIPITLGGGIKTLKDIDKALNSGADKIAINSASDYILINSVITKFNLLQYIDVIHSGEEEIY